MDPLKLSKLGVKRPLLQPPQFQSKPRSELLQVTAFPVLENIPMPSKKDKVSLVVECSYLTALEFRDVRKERGKHSTNGVTESG